MFVAIYEKGMVVESDRDVWTSLPDNEPILIALLINQGRITGFANQDKFWFSNEGVSTPGGGHVLVGQILGCQKGDQLIEVRQDVRTGEVKRVDIDKSSITTDHKPGRVTDETAKGWDNFFTRVYRGLQQRS
jgi:hypothetical protein